jgi:23S rRNA G2069 N7-methylase RlmK/C1962 C5-methylase RlmI
MFYFDREDERVLFGDIRSEQHVLCDGRVLSIDPNVITDFRALPFEDEAFRVVVFDPPHLVKAGPKSWQAAKYGRLTPETWRDDLRAGFAECFRVLAPNGVLIFKWAETQIPVSQILALTEERPLVGHRSGKRSGTHWMTFLKASV